MGRVIMRISVLARLAFIVFIIFAPIRLFADKLDEEFTNLIRIQDSQRKIDNLVSLIEKHVETNPQNCLIYADSLYYISQRCGNKASLNRAKLFKGNAYSRLNDINEAIKYITASISGFQSIEHYVGLSGAKIDLAQLYYRMSNYQQTIYFLNQSINAADQAKDTSLLSRANSNLAMVYLEMGKYEDALKYYLKALKYAEALKNNEYISTINIGLANIYIQMRQFDKASAKYRKVERLCNENKIAKTALSFVYYNLGYIFSQNRQLDSAEIYYYKAIAISKKYNDELAVGMYSNTLADFYIENKDLKKAENAIRISLEILHKFKNVIGIADGLIIRAKILKFQKKFDRAICYADSARILYIKVNSLVNEKVAVKLLAELYFENQNFENSAKMYKLLNIISDSLINTEMINKLQSGEAKFNLEKSSKEIELLQKDNAISGLEISKRNTVIIAFIAISIFLLVITLISLKLAKVRKLNSKQSEANQALLSAANTALLEKNCLINEQNIELEKANQDKDKLFSILAHDLKTPLTISISSSELVVNHFEKLSEEQLRDYCQKIYSSSIQLNELLNNILDWAMSRNSNISTNPQNVDLKQIIAMNLNIFKHIAANKNIEILDESKISISAHFDPDMLNAIIRNFLSNSIKFSDHNSKIRVELMKTTRNGIDYASIIIDDEGPGLTEYELANLQSYSVLVKTSNSIKDKAKGSGLGLIICKEFLQLNHSYFEAKNSDKGYGLTISIFIPLLSEDTPIPIIKK
jgi:signal transduction histidine kinase